MSREIVINATPEETRVVVLEAGRAAEIRVERANDQALVGAVFLGRVDRVIPGMQAAFVDIGLARHAFLYVTDAQPDAALGDEADDAEEGAGIPPGPERPGAPSPRIEELVMQGQPVVVQITREPIGTKGPRVTARVTLAGKFLVYMPLSQAAGISRRITEEAVRGELRRVAEALRAEHAGGFILRTAAAGQPEATLRAEAARLAGRWEAVRERVRTARPPAHLHEELPLALRVLRDVLSPDTSRIVVDDPALHREVSALVEDHEPRLPVVVQRHAGPAGVLDAFGLEAEIEKALRSRVWLRSGGYLVINQLEALVAVDVNTGKFTGKRHLEDTALRTNLEAAHEVARQLRLRDLGGIVVIDFIDLLEPGHRQEVMDALKEGLARDRAKTTVLDMSPFGLVQLTRQRQKPSLEAMLAEPCPYCQGSGRVQSVATTANHVLRRARALAASATVTRLVARVHPDIARHLRARLLSAAERGSALPVPLVVVEEAHRHRATFDVAPG